LCQAGAERLKVTRPLPFCWRTFVFDGLQQNRFLRAPESRSLTRTLTRPALAWLRASSFTSVEEMTMTLEQHIEELRTELRWCDRKERRQIERELQAARDELARLLAREPR